VEIWLLLLEKPTIHEFYVNININERINNLHYYFNLNYYHLGQFIDGFSGEMIVGKCQRIIIAKNPGTRPVG